MFTDLLGKHHLHAGMENKELVIGRIRIVFGSSGSSFLYKRYADGELKAEAMIISGENPVTIGVFPSPPLLTPTKVAENLCLKFRSPIVVDQRSEVLVYAKMPIEIAVFRQSGDEEVLLDAFSLQKQRYALYGSPESGVVCRYNETEVSIDEDGVKAVKYEEAAVKIMIKNAMGTIVKVNRVIIPMEGVILDHAHDDSWLPGSVEMHLDSAFGKEIVNVRLVGAKVKRADKTSLAKKDETLTFLMDTGY